MSAIDDITGPGGDDVIAAEYVLGTMDAQSRQAFAERIAREPGLARAIDAWRMRLAPLADDIAPVVPPMYLWHKVRARAGLDVAQPARVERERWWDRIAFWRGMSLAGLAATTACVIALIALPRNPASQIPAPVHSALPHPVRLVSTMNDGKGRNTYMAAVDDDACTLVLMPLVKDPTPGEVPQVWLVSSDGSTQSLGVGNDAPLQSMTVPDALRAHLLRDDHTIAVSMEPPGGSKTGHPTGFVIGRGQLTHL
ncbi:RskA domain containing protein [Lysobacter dokdonensis DS-58]|uniref:RskA domain containing protein n=1 Tax=Lysobacter dokdonensis DS-58 TaxID=1300345 RepID=A0A0A2WIC9_9GAMM|nr:anti-sigma factor [Lysobacter dokdonensis]KGQ19946.1 RskA domain containing protein [Lysobacter dokdonensis DS-58]